MSATTRWPHSGSSTPVTATSRTASIVESADLELLGPELLAAGVDDEAEAALDTELARRRPHRRRPWGTSRRDRRDLRTRGLGASRYERKSVGVRTQISPSTLATSTPGSATPL